jgi:hypothetical protein
MILCTYRIDCHASYDLVGRIAAHGPSALLRAAAPPILLLEGHGAFSD